MPLFKTTIEKVTGRGAHLFDGVGEKLLNSIGVEALKERDATKSSFDFVLNLGDDREGIVSIESEDDAQNIRVKSDLDDDRNFITLNVYKDATGSGTTEEETFGYNAICFGYAFSNGTILYVRRGPSLARILVSDGLDSLLAGIGGIIYPGVGTITYPGTGTIIYP